MNKKIINKLIQSVCVMLCTSFFTFALMYLSPSDPAEMLFKSRGVIPSDATLKKARMEMGLINPFAVQYADWMKNIFNGDFGYSYINGSEVDVLFKQRLPYTLELAGVSLILLIFFSFLFGILSAVFKGTLLDWIIRLFSLASISIPSFWLGLLLILFLSIKIHIFKINSLSGFKGIVLPAATLTIPLIGRYTRQIRAAFLEEMSANYVVGLKSLNINHSRIILLHVLPNAMKGILALLGLSLAGLLGGTVIVESIFSWPGIGSMAMDAITNRDYQVLQAYVLFMAIVYTVMSFIVELTAELLDPRLKMTGN